MRRWLLTIVAAVGVVFAILTFLGLAYTQSLRRSRIILGRSVLQQAQQQLAETGRVQAIGSWRPFEYTNNVEIDGVIHRCSVATPLNGFDREGVFAMTTNETFLWIDKRSTPKVIPSSGYSPRFFPSRF